MTAPMEIDGSEGEGGGQILRSALALSLLLERPLHITRIRAGRKRPGLMRQHLVAVQAARAIGDAGVRGAEIGSTELEFLPGRVRGGEHSFAIGSAGSTTLVLQTVLLPLLFAAGEPTELRIEGGTHNPMAPTFDFLAQAFLPLLRRLGAHATVELDRHGFYPAGGGRLRARIEPRASACASSPFSLLERGALRSVRGVATVCNLPRAIADRELRVLAAELDGPNAAFSVQSLEGVGPGNVVEVRVESENVTEIFSHCGEKGVPAEAVAASVAREANAYLRSAGAVAEHLADQLVLPLAFFGGGSFRASALSRHCRTQIELTRRYAAEVRVTEEPSGACRIDVSAREPRGS